MGENVYVWCLIKVTLCTAKLMVGIAVLKAKTMHSVDFFYYNAMCNQEEFRDVLRRSSEG